MNRSQQSRTWEVLGVSAVAGGAGPAGGEFIFHFKSPAGVAVMSLTCYGLGAGGMGGSVGGAYSSINSKIKRRRGIRHFQSAGRLRASPHQIGMNLVLQTSGQV